MNINIDNNKNIYVEVNSDYLYASEEDLLEYSYNLIEYLGLIDYEINDIKYYYKDEKGNNIFIKFKYTPKCKIL